MLSKCALPGKSAVRAAAAGGWAPKARALSTDVVVVGGGVAGCATARALAARGASVVLLEQNRLTTGTTWHAAGLLGTLKGSASLMKLSRYGNETYRGMVDETTNENVVGWANTGSLYIARCADSMEQLIRTCQMAHGIGHTHHRVVKPEEIRDIHPFLNLDGVVGGVYSPEDGICNPGDVAMFMAKEARASGAVIREGTEVVAVATDSSGRRALSVRTSGGEDIACGDLVLCGGAWTKKLSAQIFGENRVPVAMMPHQYVIFDKTEGVGNHLPVTRDIHHKYYLKPEVGGFMVGVFEGEPLEHLPEAVKLRNANVVAMPRDAENEVYPESVEKAGRWLEAAMEHCPALGEVGVKQWLHGPDTHSTDHSPIIGLMPGADNCYVATGFNSQGIQCGPGTGLVLSEMILDGAAHSLGCDLAGAEPTRVFPGLCQDAAWVEMRAAEGYGKNYSVHFPGEVCESARGRRLSPVHAQLVEEGAVFGETYGWERALYFPTPEERARVPPDSAPSPWRDDAVQSVPQGALSWDRAQTGYFNAEARDCLAARSGVALFDLSSFGKLRVSGARSLEVLQMAMTAEMDRNVGSVTYSLFCNPRGGVLGDLTVARLGPEDFYIVTVSIQPEKVADHLRRVARSLGADAAAGCAVEDVTEAHGVLALNGPRSRTSLQPLTSGSLDNEAFAPGTAQHLEVAGVRVLALRVSFAGELGWELHCPAGEAPRLYAALTAAGARPAGLFALLNSLRTEKGFIHYGGDVGLTETPLHAGLGFACKLKPGQADFLGKAAIMEQKAEGITRRLVSVRLTQGTPSLFGHEQELLYRDGELVGSLTSGGYSHTLGCPMGLGYVRGPRGVPQDWLKAGAYEVEVPTRSADGTLRLERFPAEISTKCLVDPKGARVRGDYERLPELDGAAPAVGGARQWASATA